MTCSHTNTENRPNLAKIPELFKKEGAVRSERGAHIRTAPAPDGDDDDPDSG
jgi:hypothetical protein